VQKHRPAGPVSRYCSGHGRRRVSVSGDRSEQAAPRDASVRNGFKRGRIRGLDALTFFSYHPSPIRGPELCLEANFLTCNLANSASTSTLQFHF
jgi:hypothetical protein